MEIKQQIATIRSQDEVEGEVITLYIVREEGDYVIEASNGDDVGGKYPFAGDAIQAIYAMWQGWESFTPRYQFLEEAQKSCEEHFEREDAKK